MEPKGILEPPIGILEGITVYANSQWTPIPQTVNNIIDWLCTPSLFPGNSKILSRSRGEKSGEGLGSLLRHGLETVDSVSANRVRITY